MAATRSRTLRMSMVGIGVGGAEILPAMESTPGIELYAGADINPTTRERFQARYPEAQVYDSIESLCADPDVDAVWVSSPNRFHAPHAIYALEHGKHVVVEKPMALSLQETDAMNEAAAKNNVYLMAGHTQAYSIPIRAMRKVINSGKIGKLTNLQVMAYTDWMLRPRSEDELDFNQGGGVPWRQTPHQVDTVRLLGGGMVRSVRGTIGQWGGWRPIPGFYSAYMEFEDGTPCHILHNGYGYFHASELTPEGAASPTGGGRYTSEERGKLRRAMRSGTRDEDSDKQALRIGGEANARTFGIPETRRAWGPGDLGFLIVNTEDGAIRHSPFGIYIYDDDGRHDIDLTGGDTGGVAGRRGELEEFYACIIGGQPMFHTGVWGAATLEVALAIMQSAREHKDIILSRQVAVPDSYDADLKVPFLDN